MDSRPTQPTAEAGSALGGDVSALAIERARGIARAEGLGNVAFERADAQVHRYPPERFDLGRLRRTLSDNSLTSRLGDRRGPRGDGYRS